MRIESHRFTLKNGKTVTLRNAGPCDAEAVLDCVASAYAETHFLLRYPDEMQETVTDEKAFLEAMNDDINDLFLIAETDGTVVGTAGFQKLGVQDKIRHRATCFISIRQAYTGAGLGTEMVETLLSAARKTDFTQLELGVFADNAPARRLYARCGFTETGVYPRAFRLRDGSYIDEIQMIYRLK